MRTQTRQDVRWPFFEWPNPAQNRRFALVLKRPRGVFEAPAFSSGAAIPWPTHERADHGDAKEQPSRFPAVAHAARTPCADIP